MKKSNQIQFQKNRQLILDNLPGTYESLKSSLRLHENTLFNHIKKLKEENLIHVEKIIKRYTSGIQVDYFVLGPKPSDDNKTFTKQPDRIPKIDFLTSCLFSKPIQENEKTI